MDARGRRLFAVAVTGVLVLYLAAPATANLNVYLTRSEVRRLFGLDAELFYVREGVINTYALNFTVPVPANFSRLYFTWQSLIRRPMPYVAQVDYDNGDAMALPQLNISAKGLVPTLPDTFSLTLPCSGRVDAEVQVNLLLNVTTHDKVHNTTALTIRRKKICLKGEEFKTRNESIYLRPEWVSSSLGTLYVAMGSACTITVLVITIAAVLYLRVKRARQEASLTCRYYNAPGFLGAGDSASGDMTNPTGASLKSNSYATIASLKKMQMVGQKVVSQNGQNSNNGSLHYASSPLSQVYSQPYSPVQSLPASRISQSSWCARSSLNSHGSWRDPRQLDPTDRIRELSVDRWRVVVGDALQEGTFGRVHEGLCNDPYTHAALPVIVKTVTGEASLAQARLAIREGFLLAGLRHPNLLPVLGICTADPRRPLLLYPHLGLNNLKQYLLGKNRGGASDGSKLMTRDAVRIAIGVCQGLLHLHQQRILHRDVAARNCMVDKEFQACVTDTALSRDLFPQDYHCLGDNENRPVKWLSIEALVQKQFSAASDVWMFGVFVWELMTLAQQPYIEVDPFEMAAYLRDGYRLSQPQNCPDDLFAVMAVCWAPDPEDRPSLTCLLTCLQDFHSALSTFI